MMIIARSIWRKAFATIVAALAFVSLYEVTTLLSGEGYPIRFGWLTTV